MYRNLYVRIWVCVLCVCQCVCVCVRMYNGDYNLTDMGNACMKILNLKFKPVKPVLHIL